MPPDAAYRPEPRLGGLELPLHDPVEAAAFPRHVLRFRNQPWAARVGLGDLSEAEWEAHFAAFEALPDNQPRPLALRYHGHQFRHYNPDLGDGRGFLFAQLRDPVDGRLLDLGTKGSGTTRWSRGGDGRLTLKGGFREALATELLEALGVNTSKTFSLFETGEALQRWDEPSPTRSCVMVRLSHSHVRFGSFQRLAWERKREAMAGLVEHVVECYYPELMGITEKPTALLRAATERCARLTAQWMTAGFVHGVLNTDNMNITGESFDYGPYRFLPNGDPGFTAAYFDNGGLYAYGRQPGAVLWNLRRLAEALSQLTPLPQLAEALADFPADLRRETRAALALRLGLQPREGAAGRRLVEAVSGLLLHKPVGWERFFFDHYGGPASLQRAAEGPAARFYVGPLYDTLKRELSGWTPAWPERLEQPYFQGDQPCTLLYEEIEALWEPIDQEDDWSAFEAKVGELRDFARLMGRGA
ncbi:MAG: YdiU family protein [Alphaproteobacteria bacterium]|nr:YdiU family protein [Alphaproteobacteria bacterium]